MTKSTTRRKALALVLALAMATAMAPATALGGEKGNARGLYEHMYDSDIAALEQIGLLLEPLAQRAVAEKEAALPENQKEIFSFQNRRLQVETEKARLKNAVVAAYFSGGGRGNAQLDMPSETKRHIERAIGSSREDRFIVKFKAGRGGIDAISKTAGVKSVKKAGGFDFVTLESRVNPKALADGLLASGAAKDIEYITPDFKLRISSGPEDQLEGLGGLAFEGGTGSKKLGGAEIVVAVLDSQIDGSHPGLAGRLTDGWNFLACSGEIFDAENPSAANHGTSVTGAVVDNADGWDVKVMPLVVFEEDGKAHTSTIIEALEFAEGNGAKIANCSFSGSQYNPALKEAVENSSLLICCAAGNARSGLPVFPAAYGLPNTVSVASLNADSGLSYFSNFGETVDISALGRNVLSTLPGAKYGKTSGTSMAAAAASGAAAAVLSKEGLMEAAELKVRLIGTADKLAHLQNKLRDGRRLNLGNALAGVLQNEAVVVEYEEDFDAHGISPTPRGGYGLLSSGSGKVSASAGEWHSLMLMADGGVWSAGSNDYGQLGDGNQTGSNLPVQAAGLADIAAVAAGAFHSLALTGDGAVYSFGDNEYGALGNGSQGGSVAIPMEIPDLEGVVKIAAGGAHSLAVDEFGICWGWGDSAYGQAGVGVRGDPWRYFPMPIDGLFGTQIVDVSAGAYHSLALAADGTVFSWGANDCGQLGVGVGSYSIIPYLVQGLPEIVAVSAGGGHSLALDVFGKVWAWGDDSYCQIAGVPAGSAPSEIEGLSGVAAISAGTLHSAAADEAGNVYAWGANYSKQAGAPGGGNAMVGEPYLLEGFDGVADVSAGGAHNLARKTDQSLWAWGDDCCGQLGAGGVGMSAGPIMVAAAALTEPGEPVRIAFDESAYHAYIPEGGSAPNQVQVKARAYDEHGAEVGAAMSYAISSCPGVAINAATGIVTVADEALELALTATAMCGGLTATATLTLEHDEPELANFKFFKMETYPSRYPVSENHYKSKENYSYAPYSPNNPGATITFSLQYDQTASLKLFEYTGEPGLELTDFGNGTGGLLPRPAPAKVDGGNPQAPTQIGYVKAYNATGADPADYEDLPWPLLPEENEEGLEGKLKEIWGGLKDGTKQAVQVKDMPFYGYSKEKLPDFLKPRGGAAKVEFIHNILLWDGEIVDEQGATVNVAWDKGKTYLFVLDTEAAAPGNDFNSYLAFKIDPDAPGWLSEIEFDELFDVFGGDPVNMVDGSLTYERTDLREEGAKPLAFTATYRSRNAGKDYGLGHGWSHNHMYSLLFGHASAMALLPDGKKAYFRLGYDGQWAAREGSEFSFYPQGEEGQEGFLMTSKAGAAYLFDSEGRISSITEKDGEVTEYAYSPQGRLETAASRAGQLTFAYTPENRISEVTDSSGRHVKYFYDGAGDLISSENCEETDNTLNYAYDGNHCLETVADFLGTVYMANSYDSVGRVATQYVEGQGTTVFEYDAVNRVNKTTGPADPKNPSAPRKYMEVHYDESGRATAVEDNDGTAGFEYNFANQVESVTDKLGHTTRFEHDGDGNVTLVAYPDGTAREYEYYENKLVKTITQADASTLEFEYDSRGNLTEAKDGNGNRRHWHYDANNNLEWYRDALGKYTYYGSYDSKGNPGAAEDHQGNVTRYTYDSVGRLLRVETPMGFETAYAYSDAGKLVGTTDARNKATAYGVNGNGFTDSVTDPMAFVTSYEYDGTSHVTKETDPEGNATSYKYDENGYRVETKDAEGNITVYGYDPLGKLTSLTTPEGRATKYSYDANGQLEKTEDPLNNAVVTVYDSMGRAKKTTNARGHATVYKYDVMGRLWKTIGPENGITEYRYDYNGNLKYMKDPEGNETLYEYDAENRLTGKEDAAGETWLYVYDDLGRLWKTITPLGAVAESGYDEDGRNVLSKDPKGYVTEFEYDEAGRLTKQENPDGTWLSYEYSDNGWLEAVTNEEGETMSYEYYGNGWLKSVTDYMRNVTAYTYMKTGQIKTITDAEGGLTVYSYYEDGNLKTVTDPENFTTGYEYDECSRVSAITDPRGGTAATTYDENGNVKTVTNADGGVSRYSYDKNGRLRFYTDPEGNLFETQYDKNGNVKKEIDARGNSKEFSYDSLDRAVEAINELGHSSFKEYDGDGRLVRLENEEGAETFYGYDLKNQLVKITDALGNETNFTYDSMGRATTETNARGAVTSYAYTSCGAIKTVTKDITSSQNAPIKKAVTTYAYNANGWLISETNPNGETTQYRHDMLGRVTEKEDPLGETEYFFYDGNSRVTRVEDRKGNATHYEYDGNGNVIRTTDALGTASEFGYDPMNRLESVTLNRVDTKHGVNELQVTLYKYDKNGRLTKQTNGAGKTKAHTYDGNGNLAETADEDGYVTICEYDPRNLIEAINYDNGLGKRATFGYNMAGELVEMVDWNGTTEFILDKLGQIKEVTDHGCNVASYDYDEIGNRIQATYPDNTAASYGYDLMDRLTTLTDAENQETTYTYDAARLTGMNYPNGWSESYVYDANGQMTGQAATDPTGNPSKTIHHHYEYDKNGNVKRETRSGAGGQDAFDREHFYDALDRLTETKAHIGQKDPGHEYWYDSLGNLVYEKNANGSNKGNEYWYDSLNRQVRKLVDNHDDYTYAYDFRGNQVEATYHGNGANANRVVEQYAYDATNRMVKGKRYVGASVGYEESHYVYNGFGDLVCNEWIIAKNNYGYTGIDSSPKEQVDGVVVCDRHRHTTGQGHVNPTGNGHTAGGTAGGTAPAVSGHQAVVHKDFVVDYADPLRRTLIELESGDDPYGEYLRYRYTYGLRKVSTVVHGAGGGFMAVPLGLEPDAGVVEYAVNEFGELEFVSEDSFFLSEIMELADYGNGGFASAPEEIVKLYHHQSRLGATDYLTDNTRGGVISYVAYDDWGALTAKAVLKAGARQLDLVQDYTGHPYDQVLEAYYAKARMYDAIDRRFMAVDPVKGTVRDPQTMVQYTYCANNPLRFIDPSGQSAEDVTKWLARMIIGNPINNWFAKNGWFSSLFSAAGFVRTKDLSGTYIYHAKMDCLQQYGGYNNFYDTVFKYATSMDKAKFQFTSGGKELMLWAWKGDYLNLGAGAELGIYKQMTVAGYSTPQWLVNTSLSMHMTLQLQLNGKTIINWDPAKDKNYAWDKVWWVTGFNPYYTNVDAGNLKAIYTVTFNTQAMYDDFYKTWGGVTDPKWKWTFDPKTITATLTF